MGCITNLLILAIQVSTLLGSKQVNGMEDCKRPVDDTLKLGTKGLLGKPCGYCLKHEQSLVLTSNCVVDSIGGQDTSIRIMSDAMRASMGRA